MPSQMNLISSQYLTTPLGSEASSASADAPRVRTAASQVMRSIRQFLFYVTVAALLCTVGRWACNAAAESTTAADWFLWVAGSEQTWEEYQRDHIGKGHPRTEDEDASWLQQLFIDGYADLND